ncbi:unnamed protein product [Hymenolepis diminuta]|uniref:Secreted protein n=1 Tax=Hymenolepis diminuta TaxID=6216 RepID=A0A0R3SET2_HYMDI|nr:unnamed protein product [Hymenolepis diminuta]
MATVLFSTLSYVKMKTFITIYHIFILGLRSPCYAVIRPRLLSLLHKEPDVNKSRRGSESAAGPLTFNEAEPEQQEGINSNEAELWHVNVSKC